MNFNTLKNALSAIFVLFAPARARYSSIAAAVILLLLFAGFAEAAGEAEWQAGVGQVNNALRQLRRQAQGVPEAMQYINQAEKLWKQAQSQWAMQQRSQQQNGMNEMRTQLLAQQQNLKNQLIKQQQFLQQQLAASKAPELQTINPFGDYGAHGILLHPKDGQLHGTDMNAKEGPGMEAWKEAMRQLDGISGGSSSSTKTHATASQTPNKKGSWDNPLADEPAVRIMGSGAPSLADGERAAFLEETRSNKYGEMSPGALQTLSEQYQNNEKIQNAITELIDSKRTYKSLADRSDAAGLNEYLGNIQMGKAKEAAVQAGATALELTTDVPVVFFEKYVTGDEKAAKREVANDIGFKSAEKAMENVSILKPYSKGVPLLDKMTLFYDLNNSAPDAMSHYMKATEFNRDAKAAGGSGPALEKAEEARQNMLSRAQKLYDLIAAQER